MRASCFRGVQYLTAFMLVVSFALIVTAGVVRFWWVSGIKGISIAEQGIWRFCLVGPSFTACENRKGIFQFDHGINKDIILAGLVGSALSTLVAFVFGLITVCQRFPNKCLIVFEIIFAFFSGSGTLFSIVWALVKIDHQNTAWAFYCLYVAGGMLIFSFIFSVVMLTMRAPGSYMPTREDETVMLQRT